jgi:dipeptidyl aminopeptidase/acylaminoacyl peptidase
MLTTLLLAATVMTVEDYATMPTISSPLFSPDGKRIAYVLTRADMERSVYDSDVWVVGSDGANDIRLTHSSGNDNHPRWSPDGSTIAFLSDRDSGRAAIWLINANAGEAERLTNEKSTIADFEWSPDGKTIAFTMRDPPAAEREDFRVVGTDTRPPHLYVIDVASGAVTRLTRGTFSISNPSWSPDGSMIAVQRQSGGIADLQKGDIALVSRSGEIRMLVSWPGEDRNPQFSPDGKSIAFLSTGGIADWLREAQVYVVPVAGGTPRLVSRDYDRTPDQIIWSDARTIWMRGALNTTSQIFRVGTDGSGFRNLSQINGAINGLHLRNGSAAFVMQSLTAPPELFVSDVGKFSPHQLTHHNDSDRNHQLGETRLIRWKNPKDGLEIEGLLTLPIGYESGKRYPLLTFVHGGPASRFDQAFIGYLGFLYPVHVLAARGFAVLRPNPRGTGGYGEKFRQANRNDWGGMDWADINAGIDQLIADGIADPDRLGLMGWSYGGFMASWAEGHSDRFKAISIGAPVVDLLSFHGTTDIRAFIPSYFRTPAESPATAPTETDDATLMAMRRAPLSRDLLRERSPLWHVKPSSARVLIQHGDADDRVPLSQGTMLYRILQELGVDVSMVIYPRAPHVPREPKQLIDVMRRNVELFTSVLGERPSRPQSPGVFARRLR